MKSVQRHLLEHNKTFDKENNMLIWELVFWNENLPRVIERHFVFEPRPLMQIVEDDPKEIPEQDPVEVIPVTDTLEK